MFQFSGKWMPIKQFTYKEKRQILDPWSMLTNCLLPLVADWKMMLLSPDQEIAQQILWLSCIYWKHVSLYYKKKFINFLHYTCTNHYRIHNFMTSHSNLYYLNYFFFLSYTTWITWLVLMLDFWFPNESNNDWF